MIADVGRFQGQRVPDASLDGDVPLVDVRIGPVRLADVAAAKLFAGLEAGTQGRHLPEGIGRRFEHHRARRRRAEDVERSSEVQARRAGVDVGVIEQPVSAANHRAVVVEGPVGHANSGLDVLPVGMIQPIVVGKPVGESERLALQRVLEGLLGVLRKHGGLPFSLVQSVNPGK